MTTSDISDAGRAARGGAGPAVAGWYLYGIVPATESIPDGLAGLGSVPGPVSSVPHGEVAAVVSRVAQHRALGSRRDMLSHARVLDTLAARMPVVPARFGMVVPDPDAAVRELLAPRHDAFVHALAGLAGRYQCTMTVLYTQDTALREVLAENHEIAGLRQAVVAGAGYDARLRLGELVAAALARKRGDDAARLHAGLDGHAVAWVDRPVSSENEAASVAFLVAHERRADFERAAEALAARWASRARVRLVGPVAAYDFADSLLAATAVRG